MNIYNMIWKNIIHNGYQVVPGITHLFVRNYMEMCLKDLLEMQELKDIISCVLLMHNKNWSIRTLWWKKRWWLSTTIKFNKRSICFAWCNHIFHWLLAESLRTKFARTLSYVCFYYENLFQKIPVELPKQPYSN